MVLCTAVSLWPFCLHLKHKFASDWRGALKKRIVEVAYFLLPGVVDGVCECVYAGVRDSNGQAVSSITQWMIVSPSLLGSKKVFITTPTPLLLSSFLCTVGPSSLKSLKLLTENTQQFYNG